MNRAETAEEVNVVVEYSSSFGKNGKWVNSETGEKITDSRTQTVEVHVIRLEDWALISETSFTYQLDMNEKEKNETSMNSMVNYLREVFGN